MEIPSSRRRAGLLSVHAFHILVMEVLPSRQQGVVRVSEGFTPGYRDTVFQTESCVCPGASLPVIEIPSSRRVVLPTISVKNRVWAICVRNIAQVVLFRVVMLPVFICCKGAFEVGSFLELWQQKKERLMNKPENHLILLNLLFEKWVSPLVDRKFTDGEETNSGAGFYRLYWNSGS